MTAQKLSPRKRKSLWSELNKERCRRMERLGLMTDAGRAVFPDMSDKEFVIDEDILKVLKADPVVWENYNKFPVLYQRVRIDTIQIKKKSRNCLQAGWKSSLQIPEKVLCLVSGTIMEGYYMLHNSLMCIFYKKIQYTLTKKVIYAKIVCVRQHRHH